jgi:hypothetical protein
MIKAALLTARWSARLVAAFQRSVFVVPRMMPLRLTGFFCTATWAAVGILCVVPACPNDGIAAPQSRTVRIRIRTVRVRMKLRFKICLLNAKTPKEWGHRSSFLEYKRRQSDVFVRKQSVSTVTGSGDRAHG